MGATQKVKRAAKSLPGCQASLLCDSVIRDELTGKTTLVGIFDTFRLLCYPGTTSPCMVYLRWVDGTGRFGIRTEVQDPKRGLVLFRSAGSAKFGSPLKKTSGEMWLPLAPLPFEAGGTFDLVVFVDDLELTRLPFSVSLGLAGGLQ
jgi:hypothetical protein